jgi:hypothetical protein
VNLPSYPLLHLIWACPAWATKELRRRSATIGLHEKWVRRQRSRACRASCCERTGYIEHRMRHSTEVKLQASLKSVATLSHLSVDINFAPCDCCRKMKSTTSTSIKRPCVCMAMNMLCTCSCPGAHEQFNCRRSLESKPLNSIVFQLAAALHGDRGVIPLCDGEPTPYIDG